MTKPGLIVKKIVKSYLVFAGVFAIVFILWLILGLPIFIDRICIRSEKPIEAENIVCLGNGLTRENLPTDSGWERIYVAVQLYLDGYGNKIVFTGGGSGQVSETEIYAEMARWLGMNEGDAVFEPRANGTSDHPINLLRIEGTKIAKTAPINIVTSPLHSKRAALCFKKAGFANFRLVTEYRATGKRTKKGGIVSHANAEAFLRDHKKSTFLAYKPSGKAYNDIFIKLKKRTGYFFTALRELAALGMYKIKGYI